MLLKSFLSILAMLISHQLFASENCFDCKEPVAKEASTSKFDSKVRLWCLKYSNNLPEETGTLALEITASGYSFAEALKNPVCDPLEIGGNNRITILQHSVEKPIDRFQSLETMYNYCKKRLRNEQIFVDAVNALNTAGMSLLDYTIWVEKQNGPHMTKTLDRIRDFVCARGGVYVKYPEHRCP